MTSTIIKNRYWIDLDKIDQIDILIFIFIIWRCDELSRNAMFKLIKSGFVDVTGMFLYVTGMSMVMDMSMVIHK